LLAGQVLAVIRNDQPQVSQRDALRRRRTELQDQLTVIDATDAAADARRRDDRERDAVELQARVATLDQAIAVEQRRLDDATEQAVPAPSPGNVTRLIARSGERVEAGAPLVELVDPTRLRVEAVIPMRLAMHVGDRVIVRILPGGPTAECAISAIRTDDRGDHLVIDLPDALAQARWLGAPVRIDWLGSDPGPIDRIAAAVWRRID
jgi:biotin carboxyl carrier protein